MSPLFASTPDQALESLKEGNRRFMEGKVINPRRSISTVKQQIESQYPFCAILACSDSRVATEIIFDQGIGDLFSVRLAGNVASRSAMESLDFASNVLKVSLIVVMGHQNCGAVTAAFNHSADDELGAIASLISPAIEGAKNPSQAILNNVHVQVKRLMQHPMLLLRVKEKTLKIVGAYYDFNTGKVEFFENISP